MKSASLFSMLPLLCCLWAFSAQTAGAQHRGVVFGAPGVNDAVSKLIRTADQHYVTVGHVGKEAAIYKFDCAGNIVDSFRLAVPNANLQFVDVLELPNGEFVAVGHQEIADDFRGLAVRLSADLQELALQIFYVFGREASLRQIVRNDAGQVYLGGHVRGVDVDFTNIFCATFDPLTLAVQDSITEFTNGVDDLLSMTLCADGNLLLTGVHRWGDIFTGEGISEKLAFIRKTTPDGTLLWEYVRDSEFFKNKFGLSYFSDAIENEATGNILVVGNKFTGDEQSNVLDAHWLLLSADGDSLDALTIAMPGSQNLYQVIPSPNPDVPGFFAVGDSTPSVFTNFAVSMVVTVNEVNQQLELHSALTNQDAPATVRSVVQVSAQPPRISFAGIFYNPGGGGQHHDGFVALPALDVEIEETNGTLTAIVQPSATGYQYQWYISGQPIAGANSVSYTPVGSGEYSVVVTDPQECTGDQTYSITVGNDEVSWLDDFRLFPNPNAGAFTVQINGQPQAELAFALFNPTGQMIGRQTHNFQSGSLQHRFDFGDLPPGIYTLQIQAKEEAKYVRVMMMR